MQSDIFVDPSLAGPDIEFSTGQVSASGEEEYDPDLPDIEGDPDASWNITQWSTPADDIFDPDTIVTDDPSDDDPLLGAALASWHTGTASGGSTFVVYDSPATGITFRLGASGGDNKDTFLQTTGYASGAVTFDRQITFTAEERLVTANAGTGTAIAFNGFTVFFNASDNPSYSSSLPQTEIFLQVPLTDFRGEPGAFTTLTSGNTYQQIYNTSSWTTDAAGDTVADESSDYLAFAADTGSLHEVTINLNQALLRMVELLAAENPSMASEYLDLSLWSLGSVYSGVETGGGDGTDAATLTMDIADPVVTRDTSVVVSSDDALTTVQSIDDGTYAESEDATVIDTLAGATDTVRLTNADGAQTFTGNGDDTVLASDSIDATLHGLGSTLVVEGDAGDTADGDLVVDGTAALSVSGTFNTLSVSSDAAAVTISATVLSDATLSLGGDDASVSVQGRAAVTLSGTDATFSAGSGQVVLAADGATIDQNGAGAQTVFLNGYDVEVTQTGTGTQLLVGQQNGGGQVSLTGGAGTQVLWTGDSAAMVDASGSGVLALYIQSGSNSTVSLAGETTAITTLGGDVSVTGGSATGQDQVSVEQGTASVQGGAETMVASLDGNGQLWIEAGSGAQTIFGGSGTLVVMGSHDVAGSQIIVDGSSTDASATIFGGKTVQTVWTGNASDTIVSSMETADAGGRIDIMVQGGTSSYWGGVESAGLINLGGTLDAFLSGGGAVSVLADMAGHTDTVLTGFDSRLDSLVLQGVSDPSLLHVSQSAAGTLLSFGNSQVLLQGILTPTITQTGAGLDVSGWG